jgi:GH24 family phage-related lysozyme (muramidase)
MSATAVDAAGFAFTARFEGGQSSDGLYRAYYDPYGKVWTIGIGETHGVHEGMVWTAEQAYEDFKAHMASTYVPPLLATGYDFNQNELNGFADAAWNLGPGIVDWDVGRYLKAKDVEGAANALLAYDTAGGEVLSGLKARREAERELILTPAPTPVPADPHGYLLFDDTVRTLGKGHSGSERDLVETYDRMRAHPRIYPRRLKVLRADMAVLVLRLKHLINDSHDPTAFHRSWRLAQLEDRADGKQVVS